MKRVATALGLLVIPAVAAIAARNSVSDQFPIYANGGKPDLVVDPQRFEAQMGIVDRLFEVGDCALEEGSVGAAGVRRILRFDTVVMNMGDGDLVIGDRADPNNPYAAWFEFAPCHGHYHIRGFSTYQLLNLDGSVAAEGHKQGFCFEDSLKYSGNRSAGFTCAFQGITSGWGDWYFKQLSGQWIDITGVAEGDYVVRVSINDSGTFDEGSNRYSNVVETFIHVPDPRNKVD